MDHFIEQIEIKNFKSIRELSLTGFKRINLLIGRPNVGKSNLLEALALFDLEYTANGSAKVIDLLRMERRYDLFYNGEYDDGGIIIDIQKEDSSSYSSNIEYDKKKDQMIIINLKYPVDIMGENPHKARYLITEDLRVTKEVLSHKDKNWFGSENDDIKADFLVLTEEEIDLKFYSYKKYEDVNKITYNYLSPPHGNNIVSVLEGMPALRKIYAKWFRQYNLRLVLDFSTQTLRVQKDKGDEVFQLPYSSVADTLQRIIFYKTAIASNENSVLLFEEPEAHAYPPYISEFTQEVIGSKTNQTFIVTHSPLIVSDMLDNAIDDLAIFIVDFKDGQTVSRPLTQEELYEVRKFGVDLFFNGEAYPV